VLGARVAAAFARTELPSAELAGDPLAGARLAAADDRAG
jgi:hypothetical protein